MSTAIIDKKLKTERKLYENLEDTPPIEINEASVPYPEEELISLEEFKAHFEKRLYERFGVKLDLSSVE